MAVHLVQVNHNTATAVAIHHKGPLPNKGPADFIPPVLMELVQVEPLSQSMICHS